MNNNLLFTKKFQEINQKYDKKIAKYDFFAVFFVLSFFMSSFSFLFLLVGGNIIYGAANFILTILFGIFSGYNINKWYDSKMFALDSKIQMIQESMHFMGSNIQEYFNNQEEFSKFLLLLEKKEKTESEKEKICSVLIEKEEDFHLVKENENELEKIKEKYQLLEHMNNKNNRKEMVAKYNL